MVNVLLFGTFGNFLLSKQLLSLTQLCGYAMLFIKFLFGDLSTGLNYKKQMFLRKKENKNTGNNKES